MSEFPSKCQVSHEFCGEVTWAGLAWPLLWWPLIANVVIAVIIFPILGWFYWDKGERVHAVWWAWLRRNLGHANYPQSGNPKFLMSYLVLELCSSLCFTVIWIFQSYSHKVGKPGIVVESVLCIVFLVNYSIHALRHQFCPSCVFHPSSLVTVFTVLPPWCRGSGGSDRWFSFSYLRMWNVISAYGRMEKRGLLYHLNEIQRKYIYAALQLVTLVIISAGTVLNLEILGDPDVFRDNFMTTEMGGISFLQMCYWIFTTISTVGYGDYSPKGAVSRVSVIVIIVVGCVFFSIKASQLVHEHAKQASGRGRYTQQDFLQRYFLFHEPRQHVVLVGGGISEVSSLIRPLVDELLGGFQAKWPNICIMSVVEQPEAIKEIIRELPIVAQHRIQYFVGNPINFEDTERLRVGSSAMVIIVANDHAQDMEQEDQNNIMRALALIHAYPSVNLHVMLLRPSSKVKAVQVGICPSRCISISEMKSCLFAVSCSVRGWSSMITNLMKTSIIDDLDNKDLELDPWAVEYKKSQQEQINGFLIDDRFVGLTFLEFAQEITQHGILPIAVQIGSTIQLNPSNHKLESDDVVFAISPLKEALYPFQDHSRDWRKVFVSDKSDAAQHFLTRNPVHHRTTAKIEFKTMTSMVAHSVSTSHSSKTRISKVRTMSVPDLAMSDEELEKLQNIADAGGHYIMVVLSGNPWLQVQAFLQALYCENYPFQFPIIVLAPEPDELSNARFDMTDGNFSVALKFTTGQATISDLLDVGLHRARCVVLFAGDAGETNILDRRMVDGIGVTLLSSIEFELREEQYIEGDGPAFILELHEPESICCLSRYPICAAPCEGTGSQLINAPLDFTSHPRFASGSIFAANCLGALLAKVHHTPGTVELLEALVLGPSSGQMMQPWQVAVPEEAGIETYGDLVQFFLRHKERALCLGLYRRCWPNCCNYARYVVTNPHPLTALSANDLVIVLSSAAFGQECYDRGLIVGATGASPSVCKGNGTHNSDNTDTDDTADFEILRAKLAASEAREAQLIAEIAQLQGNTCANI